MIKILELKCFRRHEDLCVNFTPGLNVIRSRNEGGKSTLIEGILHALYGVKAIRTPLAEAVTWGRKESDLKVRLVTEINGITQVWTRSKSGAECNWKGGRITGHAEVTKFAAELLGADAKVAGNLMLASQSGLRGSLDEGPTAVSGLMGKLASFDILDKLVEAGAQTLLLGAEEPIRQKIAAAEAEVQAARESSPTAIQIGEAKNTLDEAVVKAFAAETAADAMRAQVADADEAIVDAKARAVAHDNAALALSTKQRMLDNERSALDKAQVQASARPDADALAALRAKSQDATQHQRVVDAYKAFQALPAYLGTHWEGDEDSFRAEMSIALNEHARFAGLIKNLESQRQQLEKSRIKGGKCPTCGLSAMSDEHVQEMNRAIDIELEGLKALQADAVRDSLIQKQTLTDLEAVDRWARAYTKAYSPIGGYLEIDFRFYPPKPSWRGEVPVQQPIETLKRELESLELKEGLALQAEGAISVHTQAIALYRVELEKLTAILASLPPVDIEPYNKRYDELFAQYTELSASVRTLQAAVLSARQVLENLEQRLQSAVQREAVAQARIEECNQDLRTLAFNNVLMKKLKGMKPLITDHLWNKVLAAVSSFFSTLRGESSVVTKDGDGFKVNGQAVESLSGSTLDILALAIRVALTKTFIPHASFLVLDEPSQGCDVNRTGSLLGFLAGVGVDQTIIASHDELSESVANNVILLGV